MLYGINHREWWMGKLLVSTRGYVSQSQPLIFYFAKQTNRNLAGDLSRRQSSTSSFRKTLKWFQLTDSSVHVFMLALCMIALAECQHEPFAQKPAVQPPENLQIVVPQTR